MSDPFNVVRQFESDLCEYTGAPYAVATTSCTMALLLACAYHKVGCVEIPKRTYVGVAQSILNAGGTVKFDDRDWTGWYALNPYPIWDSARWISGGMYDHMAGQMVCLSFHWGKQLSIQQGGAILLDDPEAAAMLRRMRFDGRTEGVPPDQDDFVRGYHAYMSPELAALGVMKLKLMGRVNGPMPKDSYPDLSLSRIFQ
jgi:dTDP-4-amino-4,6-dideoxygalactose transaminase